LVARPIRLTPPGLTAGGPEPERTFIMLIKRLSVLTAGVMTLAVASSTSAQNFDLSWFTIDGGGDMFSTGGDFELSGTIGQPDAGVVLSGGSFELVGGFWAITSGGAPPGCAGDLDGDGDTDLADLGILLADFGCLPPPNCPGDLDNDGDTDLADLGILLADFGCTP
jgi:hypothetical protein